jgi:hypothetical protein
MQSYNTVMKEILIVRTLNKRRRDQANFVVVAHAQVDDEDYDRLAGYRWLLSGYGYAITYLRVDGRRICKFMHRAALDPDYMSAVSLGQGLTKGTKLCDHGDHNKLNNQRSNLRWATHSQNGQNRLLSPRNKSGCKGVLKLPGEGKWRADIRVNGIVKRLGQFTSFEVARDAYTAAAVLYHSEFAHLSRLAVDGRA